MLNFDDLARTSILSIIDSNLKKEEGESVITNYLNPIKLMVESYWKPQFSLNDRN